MSKSITYYLDTPQTQVLSKRYGARLQKMTPEARMHLVALTSSAHLRNLSPKEADRTKDIPFEAQWSRNEYEQALNIIRDLPTDEKTVAKFVQAIVQTF